MHLQYLLWHFSTLSYSGMQFLWRSSFCQNWSMHQLWCWDVQSLFPCDLCSEGRPALRSSGRRGSSGVPMEKIQSKGCMKSLWGKPEMLPFLFSISESSGRPSKRTVRRGLFVHEILQLWPSFEMTQEKE